MRAMWGGRWDSNPRRPGSQPGALPTELRPPLRICDAVPFAAMGRSYSIRIVAVGAGFSREWENAWRTYHPSTTGAVPIVPAGAPGRIRTCNRRLRRPMLYPIELRAQRSGQPTSRIGRGRRIRTADPLLPKQMRYQTAPCPAVAIPSAQAGRNDSRRPAWRGHDDTADLRVSQLNGARFSYGNRGLASSALALSSPLLLSRHPPAASIEQEPA